jgi:2,3-bisphosphoglycerate-dependent phosphoglycerate mutase
MSDRDSFEQTPLSLPDGATEVVLIRHGASAPAVPGVRFELIDGRSDPPLSDVGHAQASAVARRLVAEGGLSRLYTSTLRRTHETAAPLAAATGLTPTAIPELAEVRLGEWEGGEYRVRAGRGDPIAKEVFVQQRWDVIPGAESLDSLGARVRTGVERIVAETGADAIAAAVVHGAVIGELCRQAADSRPFAFVHADNGSLSRLIVAADGGWMLRSFNDTAHLTTPLS